jgi:hypothetical protein
MVHRYAKTDLALYSPDGNPDRAVWVSINTDGTLNLDGVTFPAKPVRVVTPAMWEAAKANRQASQHRYGNNHPGAFVLKVNQPHTA